MKNPSQWRAELMDDPELPLAETERALADIERVHRWVGNGALWRRLRRLAADSEDAAIWLDVGTGSGAVAAQAAARAGRSPTTVATVGVDRKLAHLLNGRRCGYSQLRVVGDAAALPFADRAVDVSFSTLFQHHFAPREGARVLAEMRRVARRGAVVVDLRRSWLGSMLGRLVLALLRVGPVARYDGRVSLAQGWTLAQVRHAVPAGGLRSLRRCWPFRYVAEMSPLAGRSSDEIA